DACPLPQTLFATNLTDARGSPPRGAAPTFLGPPRSDPLPRRRRGFGARAEYWTIAYEGKQLRLRDAKGLQYVADLLRHEGDELHAADLAGRSGASDRAQPDPERGGAAGLGDAGEVLDHQARALSTGSVSRTCAASSTRRPAGAISAAPRASARRSSFWATSSRGPTASAGGRARRRT